MYEQIMVVDLKRFYSTDLFSYALHCISTQPHYLQYKQSTNKPNFTDCQSVCLSGCLSDCHLGCCVNSTELLYHQPLNPYRSLFLIVLQNRVIIKQVFKCCGDESASSDLPFLLLGNPANARPAIFLHRCKIFEALKIHRHISSLLMRSLLADRIGLVDVVNAAHFKIVWAVSSEGEGQHGKYQKDDLHLQIYYFIAHTTIIHTYNPTLTKRKSVFWMKGVPEKKGVSLWRTGRCVQYLQQKIKMELKKELIEWYNLQLEEKNIFISSTDQLATGYHFLEILHNYHPKTVDLSKLYLKPKNQYEVLQNYKLLAHCFAKLGWKKLDPERYSKKKEKDYLSLAQTLRKILSSRSIKDSRLQSNLDVTLEEFKSEEKVEQQKADPIGQQCKKSKIVLLQKTKKELLSKISRIHQELYKQSEGDDASQIQNLRARINEILSSSQVLN